MKIALLPSAYAPSVGGVEVLTARLAANLEAKGHKVEVWTGRSDGDALPTAEIIDGVLVRRFVFTLPRARPLSLLSLPTAATVTLRQLREALSQFGPDVLHVQCFSGNGAYAAALSRLSGVPLVVTLQGETVMDDHDIYDHSLALRTALRVGLRQAAAITGCSSFTLQDATARFGLDPGKGCVIFNGIDVDETALIPVPVPWERYVLGLGRVVRKKGFDLLLDAFSLVAPFHPEVGLVIAGDGSDRQALQRQVHAWGLTRRVHMPGQLTRGEVAAIMRGAEVFAMPSRVEPFGIVALEGWRAGVPIIVSPHGGAPEFVEHGVSGLVADPLDRAGLATAIDTLLRSTTLRRTLSEEGTAKLPEFSWNLLTGRYERLYARVTRPANSTPQRRD